MKIRKVSVLQALLLCSSILLFPLAGYTQMNKLTDIAFANNGQRDLLLDLYMPADSNQPKLIIWLHGGVWRAGNKSNPPILEIVNAGYALASVDFRNSGEAIFPAQLHDIKAAIRYLRGSAEQYGYDANSIAVWGHSSGGHLAALTGTTNGNTQLEGTLGDFTHISSDVQAILDYSGPSNFHSILHQSTAHGVNVRAPGMQDLLGKPVDDPAIKAMADLASPALQVNANSPPILIMHGVQDNQVPINQAIELQQAYERAGRPVETNWIVTAQHGSGEYYDAANMQRAVEFLRRSL